MFTSTKKAMKRNAGRPAGSAPKRTKLDKMLDDPEAVMENEKSPIFQKDVNLKTLLSLPRAQEALRAAGLDPDIVKSPGFTTAAARFKEDGSSGRHDPNWLRQAQHAGERRAAGEFDEYLQKRFEQEWKLNEPKVEEEGEDDGDDELSGPTTNGTPSSKPET